MELLFLKKFYLFFIHSTYSSSLSVSYMIIECFLYNYCHGFPGSSGGKESACHTGDLGSSPGSGKSPGVGHGNPLEYSCLENPHGQRCLAGYSPWGCKESDMTGQLSTAHTSVSIYNHHQLGAGERQWHPTPGLLPGKCHGPKSLVGCSPWGH